MIGPVVRRLRLERNLSQEALANSAHVSSGYLSKLERGLYKSPSPRVLHRIASALSIPTPELYREAGLDHLLVTADPALETLMEAFEARLEGLPKRDRDIIVADLQRVLLSEKEESK